MVVMNIRKRLLSLLTAVVLLCLFPGVYAEEPVPDENGDGVTLTTEKTHENVTEGRPEEKHTEKPTPAPTPKPTPTPTPEPTPTPTPTPTPEPTPEPTQAPTAESTPEPTAEAIISDAETAPEPEWDPSAEPEEDPEDIPDPDEDDLVEFDDDDPGTVSNDILEQFNNPDTYDRVEFNGTADIVLQEKSFAYGDEVTLKAKVSGVDISYRLVWEANDGDERGWYTISSGPDYTFTVTPENIDRGYRVVLFAVD